MSNTRLESAGLQPQQRFKNYTVVAAIAALDGKRKIEWLGTARVKCKKQDAIIPLFSVEGKTLGEKCIKLHELVDSLFHGVVVSKREGALSKVEGREHQSDNTKAGSRREKKA
jgi:hypothetical protein